MQRLLITFGILGIIGVSSLFFLAPKEQVGALDPIMSADGKQKTLSYTDENVGETLIIHSDSKDYYGFGSSVVYFSVENKSGKDQNVKVAFSIKGGTLISLKQKLSDTVVPDKFEQMASGTTQTVVGYTKTNWQDNSLKDFEAPSITRKSIKDTSTLKESGTYFIAKNAISYFKAEFTFTGNSEFFIEAFGDQSGYGMLDPNTWVAVDNFDGYSSNIQTEYNGSGWAGSSGWDIGRTNSFTLKTDQKCNSSSKSGGATADDTGNQRQLTTAVDTGIVRVCMRRSSKAAGVLDYKVQVTGTDKCRLRLNTADLIITSTGGSQTLVSNYSVDTWYDAQIYFDDTNNICKGRLTSDSAWSSTIPEQADGDVDYVALDFVGGATGSGWIDEIGVGSEPVVANPSQEFWDMF